MAESQPLHQHADEDNEVSPTGQQSQSPPLLLTLTDARRTNAPRYATTKLVTHVTGNICVCTPLTRSFIAAAAARRRLLFESASSLQSPPQHTSFCPFCNIHLSYPAGSQLIQCPSCNNTLDPNSAHQTRCTGCSCLLAYPPQSLYIQVRLTRRQTPQPHRSTLSTA